MYKGIEERKASLSSRNIVKAIYLDEEKMEGCTKSAIGLLGKVRVCYSFKFAD